MRALAGRRILDLSRYAPGPYCSLVCAALGAEVIKVEAPPDGDPLRPMDRAAFERLNAGKKSVLLDLKSREGVSFFRKLVRRADVLIESFRPGVMERLGLGYEAVKREAPSIVYVSISGYGQAGPERERAGHDVNYMARAGALHDIGKPLPLQVADFAGGGLYAVVAILAALMEGEGSYIDLSMREGVRNLMMLGDGDAAEALSGRYANYSVYRTQDGRELSVGALEPKFWKAFCDVIERPELAGRCDDPAIRTEVARILSTRTAAEWLSRFERKDVCVELVREPAEALDPSRVYELPFGRTPAKLERAPSLGEHNEEILRTLG